MVINRLQSEDFRLQLQGELKQIEKNLKVNQQIKQKAIREEDQWLIDQKEKDIEQNRRDYNTAKTEYIQIYGGYSL